MSNTDNNDDDGYDGPAWYRPGKNRDLFLGLLVLFLLVGLGGLLSRCDAGRDLAGRFGFDTDEASEDVELFIEDESGDDGDEGDDVNNDDVTPSVPEVDLPAPDVRGALDANSFTDIGVRVNGSTAVLTGIVASQALKDDAEATALEVDGIDTVDNQITIREEPEVRDLAQEIRDAHAADGVDGVTVAVDDNVATLTGTVADEATKARAQELAEQVDGIDTVVNELVIEEGEPPPPPPAADPYAVTGTVVDGVVTLTGAVSSEDLRTSLVDAMGAEIGPDNVIDEMTVDDALGEEGTVTLVGEADADVAEAIAQAAGNAVDAVGGDLANELEIAAVEPPPDLPSDLNEILRAEPILFEVNSAVIRPESLPIVDQVAEILNNNPGGKLVVEGHTDSDGDDGRNLQLSQSRADSVRTALVERDVAADRLTALGRGETDPILEDGVENKDRSRRIEFELP